MARYEHLPIFVDAYKLLLEVENEVQRFSNRHRPALGGEGGGRRLGARVLPLASRYLTNASSLTCWPDHLWWRLQLMRNMRTRCNSFVPVR